MTAPVLLLLALASGPQRPGEPVASVRLEANEADRARLARYLEIEVGQPLDPVKLRHVVELLHATGEFEDVVVETESGSQGLEVRVTPVPAPLLSAIRIEGPRALNQGRLRTVTRLRDREPLWPDRLDRAARDAAMDLVQRGYLEAQVHAQAVRHPEGADAVFRLQPGPRATVREARAEGIPPGLQPLLGGLLSPRQGQPFERRRADASVEKLRKRLVEFGYWRAEVALEVAYDPARALADILFRVEAGPLTVLEFRGEKLPADLRGAAAKLVREGRAKGDALDAAGERIEAFLRTRGHREPQVTHRPEPGPSRLTLVYDVVPGPRALVASVRVADAPTEGLPVSLVTLADTPLRDDQLAQDVRLLTRALEDRGHADAQVEAEVADGGGTLPVIFRVKAGPRTEVASVSVDSPVALPPDTAVRELKTRAGNAYRVREVALDRDGLVASYRDAGHPQVEVTPDIVISPDRSQASIRFRVLPGPRIEVDHLVLAGLLQTRETVLRRELRLASGEPLGFSQVMESQRRLGSLGLFRKIAITELDPEAEGKRSVVVAVEEAPLTNLGYGLGYAEDDRLRFSVDLTRRNLFGMDRSVSTFARVSFKGSRLVASYREPYLLGHKRELMLTAFREEAERPYYSFVRYGTSLQTSRNLTPTWKTILRYTYQLTHTFDIKDPTQVPRDYSNSTFSGPSTSLVHDTRDDPLDPRRGHLLSADVQLSSESLGGDSFLKGFLQGSVYERLTAHLVLALAARVGLGRTFGDFEPILLPEPDRFYLGGDYSLRGFKLDQVRPSGGNSQLFAGSELRLDLWRYLSGAAYVETGNVFLLASDTTVTDLRYTAGVGVRYQSPLGPLRLDWAFKLDQRPNEDRWVFHFAIGHAF